VDVEKLLRLKGAIEASTEVDYRIAGQALAASYPRLRQQAREAIDESLVEEFDGLFPERLASEGSSWGSQAGEAQGYFTQIAGWLGGAIDGALLDQRIRAEAEAKAAAESKRIGFAG
jgi:hypothetical protein